MSTHNEAKAQRLVGQLDHLLSTQLLSSALLGASLSGAEANHTARRAMVASMSGTPMSEIDDCVRLHELLINEITAGKNLAEAATAVRHSSEGSATFNRVLDGRSARLEEM